MEINSKNLGKKTAKLNEYFKKKLVSTQKPSTDMKNESYVSKTTGGVPDHEDKTKTEKTMEEFDLKTGKDLTKLYQESDKILLADIF